MTIAAPLRGCGDIRRCDFSFARSRNCYLVLAIGVQCEVAMNHLSPHTTGLALGGLLGFIHLLWALLVFAGVAQGALNFVFRMHMLTTGITVDAFSFTRAIGLIVMTFVIGYVVGWLFAKVWNMAQG